MLCHALGAAAALGGRELGHAHLPVPGTHGQRGVTAVGQELGLEHTKNREKWEKGTGGKGNCTGGGGGMGWEGKGMGELLELSWESSQRSGNCHILLGIIPNS